MPLSRKRGASDDYEADGGFVEDAPKSKKSKAAAGSSAGKGDSENEYWELGRTRRVQINEFKGKQLVDIREFYEKDDKMLPGKKGISLNIEQFSSFIEMLPEIEKSLKGKGISIPRPAYDGVNSKQDDDGEAPDSNLEAGADEDDDATPATSSRLDKYKLKANHEATSDEDE